MDIIILFDQLNYYWSMEFQKRAHSSRADSFLRSDAVGHFYNVASAEAEALSHLDRHFHVAGAIAFMRKFICHQPVPLLWSFLLLIFFQFGILSSIKSIFFFMVTRNCFYLQKNLLKVFLSKIGISGSKFYINCDFKGRRIRVVISWIRASQDKTFKKMSSFLFEWSSIELRVFEWQLHG